jgi:hypothetical protein
MTVMARVPISDSITKARVVPFRQPLVELTTGISVSLAVFSNHISKWAAKTQRNSAKNTSISTFWHCFSGPFRVQHSRLGLLTCPHAYGAGQANQAVYSSTTWESWVLPYPEAPLKDLLRYRPIPGIEVQRS